MTDRERRIAFVGEQFDFGGRCSALFDVHWESLDDHREHCDGPQGVSVAEGVAWADQHAAFVLVRLLDSDTAYSAGERDLKELDSEDDPDEPVVSWPGDAVVRPRPYT